ncbi:MAG: ATP-dependent DNA helicase RecG, partial [Geminicoccaceae bacterium]
DEKTEAGTMDVAKDAAVSKGGMAKNPKRCDGSQDPDPLFSTVSTLKGVGPRIAEALSRLLGAREERPARRLDLLMHLPHGLLDHHLTDDATLLIEGERATIDLSIIAHRPPRQRRQPYRVDCLLGEEPLQLVFFQGNQRYLQEQLPIGGRKVVSGRIGRYGKGRNQVWQIAHPDLIAAPEAIPATIPTSPPARDEAPEALTGVQWLQPVYPLTKGPTQRMLGQKIRTALDDLLQSPADLPEWQDPTWVKQRAWPSLKDALRQIHHPDSPDDVAPTSKARARLAYDELLATQLALTLSRDRRQDRTGMARSGDHKLRRAMIEALPFTLTAAQEQAAIEIGQDLAKPAKMLRLLQGDVGSGKTVVAAIAMLQVIEEGAQAALMAPTDVLVRQHANGLDKLLRAAGVTVALLTGRESGRARQAVLQRLESGEIQAVVGTHALFQDDVVFDNLGLAVIDEQHRFGVDQRIALAEKGPDADVLVMTATPIPRTLILSFYGDIAISELREKPVGRKPISTRALPRKSKLDQVVAAVGQAMARGEQIYWICPLVSPSEELPLMSAEERFEALRNTFGDKVGMAHGQMANTKKDKSMQAFSAGRTRLLVATTVVEVGVDVPAATVIVIEHAERFGLAQLHQLRGRVGRGDKPSSCLLLYATPLGSLSRARLDVMRRTEDGFFIAEEDLRLRGPGEVLGTRQSGVPSFRLADLAIHADLLNAARDDVKLVLSRDPELRSPRGQAMRLLLRWYDEDRAESYLRSG